MPAKPSGGDVPEGSEANWKQLGEVCYNLHTTGLISSVCVNSDNTTNPDYKCCKGVEPNGTFTHTTWCVDTTKPNFTIDGTTYNMDCR